MEQFSRRKKLKLVKEIKFYLVEEKAGRQSFAFRLFNSENADEFYGCLFHTDCAKYSSLLSHEMVILFDNKSVHC